MNVPLLQAFITKTLFDSMSEEMCISHQQKPRFFITIISFEYDFSKNDVFLI